MNKVHTLQGVADYLRDIAEGRIPGRSVINKFASNPLIETGTDPETVWTGGGLYGFYPDTAQDMEAVSSNVGDVGALRISGVATGGGYTTIEDDSADFVSNNVAAGDLLINDSKGEFAIITAVAETVLTHSAMNNGSQVLPLAEANAKDDVYRVAYASSTGLAAVMVYGLDANGLFQNEGVILNGTTPVALANSYLRQWRCFGLKGAARAGALGDVTIRISGAGTVACYLSQGTNSTQQAFFTVPADMVGGFLQGYVATGKGAGATAVSARFTWKATPFGGVSIVNGEVELVNTGPGYWQYEYCGAPQVGPLTDIEITCEEVSASVGVQCGMDILLRQF